MTPKPKTGVNQINRKPTVNVQMSARPKFSQRFTVFPSGAVVNFTSPWKMTNSNVGDGVIRAVGRDGHTWVTYRHPQRTHMPVLPMARGTTAKPRQKYSPRDLGRDWGKSA